MSEEKTESGRILIVDDNPDILRLLKNILMSQNYIIHIASRAKLALQFLQSTLPDLILLDITMPEMDGYELCKQLKMNDNTRHIPIIFLTGMTEMEDKIRSFQLGAVDYITKPFQEEEVIARVKNHLELCMTQKQLAIQNKLLEQKILAQKLAEEALRKAHDELEEKIKERTSELTESNRQLIKEIEERKKAQEEKERLHEQLLQTMKMESVGRLAGGVAHDYNNMLGVIIGYTEMAMMETISSEPLHFYLQEILKAARRSADLTRQLLAFARKQTASPKILCLNETVSGMIEMLRRLIGEDIELSMEPADSLWKVSIDPSQLDQILVNLVVNSRDAITGTGLITLKTDNITIDDTYTGITDFLPGNYVLLSVSDTGAGMNKEIINYIFEPFYTTKETGKGTGLGLATIYGIVKQNNGYINVYSKEGKGSTFNIYLPSCEANRVYNGEMKYDNKLHEGKETVLITEDEEFYLNLCREILTKLGYNVLYAKDPKHAIHVAENYTEPIDLLITDVVMPDMNGLQLLQKLHSIKPEMKCLYMSGYEPNIIARHGLLTEEINFIQKPFSVMALAKKIRGILGT